MKIKERFLSLMNKIWFYIKNHPFVVGFSLLFYIGAIVIYCFASKELYARLHFELSEIASCDANLFYTVGRFMASGKRPYLDAYENKPPIIFLISELSYLMSGGFYLVNVSSFLCCLNLLLVPLAICIIVSIKRKMSYVSTSLMSVLVFIISIFLMFYAEARSGEVMCELFGASALVDAILCLAILPKDKKIHFYDARIILSGFFFGVAAMFKEPFALLGIFVYLLLVENKKDLLNKVVLPISYAIFTVFVILLATNSIEGYFTIYLPNMLNNHITDNDLSLTDRMKDFRRLFDDINAFSKYLFMLVVVLLFLSVLRSVTLFNDEHPYLALPLRVTRILLPFIYLYIASLCVGLGGQYFWHHYAFALPLYYSVLIDSGLFIGEQLTTVSSYPLSKDNFKEAAKELNKPFVSVSIVAVLTLTIISGYGLKKHEFKMKEEEMVNYVKKAKEDAEYIDAVLDKLGYDSYLFIGFNGTDRPYCYTKHLPLGPTFVQDKDNFKEKDTFFVNSFLEDLHATNIIVFSSYQIPVIEDEVKQYIADNFETNKPEAVNEINKPVTFFYTLYFRK